MAVNANSTLLPERSFTRRLFLTSAPAAAATLASTAALALPAVKAVAPLDLQAWLDKADVQDLIDYHLLQLGIALNRRDPGQWRLFDNTDVHFVLAIRHSGKPGVWRDFQ